MEKPIYDTFCCPYCQSKKYVRRGFRQKKYEKIQLYLCLECKRTFTPQKDLGKHYPLETVFNALSLYNLGHSLGGVCKILNDRESGEIRNFSLQPSTVSAWLEEFKDYCKYQRMREFVIKKYDPKNTVVTATLAHRQLYRYRYHRAKCSLMIQEEYAHRKFEPLKEFLELVPSECPHQYFSEGLRASEVPITFSKKQMIVRSKTNYANKLCQFVLQSVKERTSRHEHVQKFFLFNDSVTVATEVPVYLTREDLLHMQTQLGFQIYTKKIDLINLIDLISKENPNPNEQKEIKLLALKLGFKELEIGDYLGRLEISAIRNFAHTQLDVKSFGELPKLITGHIDLLQIRNGQIHILDYKPNAVKEQPIDQLTIYAMALSRLTGLRLFDFKCAWFDEKDYFEFYPLHVLYKPSKTRRRKTVATTEGRYRINQEVKKVVNVKPT
ncbi:hypothetical protein COT49_03035 [candidate division WWE3 bacterium CG08_land_8_20_14_0_20_40_13]|uniref:PD-(D/E)XK endonuclease-like domain-containing protein n=1 Tax=candidate division WWE3 bacterium CG08_land_8_20_14_0_20_40_13 TaxID=1975084 RepID=A0A2H0XD39_UNCKA|nr:MAG: hypothetical protein COT49_03035 [candidate division WWE3 bacterium CG08_land_8_20_14_0_20_40_13]